MVNFIPISDVHCECDPLDVTLFTNPQDTVLVIAGDFYVAGKYPQLLSFVQPLSKMFKHVIYVLGNHDLWGGSLASTHNRYKQELSKLGNVSVLEKDTIVIDGVAFIGATFWTDFDRSPIAKWDAQLKMRDYKKIRNGPTNEPYKRKLFASDIENEHVSAKIYIEQQIVHHKQLGNKIVVVTHHAPSYQSKSEFVNACDPLNPCYCSNLDRWVDQLSPDFWIHGHIHETRHYQIGATTVLANPRGYSPDDLNDDFNQNWLWSL